ncbi:hypothetical protein MAPG_07405 [Magnaporthiopsis poae ATCC 64411]|uniref:Uncharacterized protein n=1 Tax=Magnaporthiopsis poae (strain ATCC 64411 / 73-15) TaxID=644358 RepID=A0A0C4E4K8_MAGP6|nr:hypothetical protein MAPG_07405 [Magnaporthiopsis poae ATCC 64411]
MKIERGHLPSRPSFVALASGLPSYGISRVRQRYKYTLGVPTVSAAPTGVGSYSQTLEVPDSMCAWVSGLVGSSPGWRGKRGINTSRPDESSTGHGIEASKTLARASPSTLSANVEQGSRMTGGYWGPVAGRPCGAASAHQGY